MGEFTIGCEDKKQPTLQQQTPPSVWHFMLEVIVTLLKLQARPACSVLVLLENYKNVLISAQ